MSKLITSALIATVLLTGVATAQTSDRSARDGSRSDAEAICKVLQRNCS
jgi:hypothetical protein